MVLQNLWHQINTVLEVLLSFLETFVWLLMRWYFRIFEIYVKIWSDAYPSISMASYSCARMSMVIYVWIPISLKVNICGGITHCIYCDILSNVTPFYTPHCIGKYCYISVWIMSEVPSVERDLLLNAAYRWTLYPFVLLFCLVDHGTRDSCNKIWLCFS